MLAGTGTIAEITSSRCYPSASLHLPFFESRCGTGPAVKGAPAEDAGRMVVVYDHGRVLAELIVTYKVALRPQRQSPCE